MMPPGAVVRDPDHPAARDGKAIPIDVGIGHAMDACISAIEGGFSFVGCP